MRINWKIRFTNPVFLTQLVLAIALPILAFAGLQWQDLTSWSIVWNVVKNAAANPYVLGLVFVSIWNAVNDPTTAGLCDSTQAMGYTACSRDNEKQ